MYVCTNFKIFIHGTSEFYQARAAISEHLIKHHGFSFVAAEADWPDAFVRFFQKIFAAFIIILNN